MMTDLNEKRKLEVADLSCIMQTESGRNVIRRIIEESGYFYDTFDQDAIQHAKRAGKRSVAVWLIEELKQAAPNDFIQLLKEHFDD